MLEDQPALLISDNSLYSFQFLHVNAQFLRATLYSFTKIASQESLLRVREKGGVKIKLYIKQQTKISKAD